MNIDRLYNICEDNTHLTYIPKEEVIKKIAYNIWKTSGIDDSIRNYYLAESYYIDIENSIKYNAILSYLCKSR